MAKKRPGRRLKPLNLAIRHGLEPRVLRLPEWRCLSGVVFAEQ